jgi:hypothetical protein
MIAGTMCMDTKTVKTADAGGEVSSADFLTIDRTKTY